MAPDSLPQLQLFQAGEQLIECTPSLPVNGAQLASLANAARLWPGVVDALYAGNTVSLWLTLDANLELVRLKLQSHWQESTRTRVQPRLHTLPVHYDGDDLQQVATSCGLSRDQVVALHSRARYTVAWLGFLPGFAYLDGLPDALHLPRRDTPRVRVPAGSLAIAGNQTALYPSESPGGWHLIGRCDLTLFDPYAGSPSLLLPGDLVSFQPVGEL
ncbi:5-oxoprolinase subunit PxpB [Ferrimonas futtsuensis]|uniref:5-oxoprolinase subunit PxpB n=1 Tax=Ferrimonas futtsuensis TaxID=364764 RepID=UPI000401AAC4|nr:5-oxoprolinase subunit PxpB [Ferrimonas futtsuensis]